MTKQRYLAALVARVRQFIYMEIAFAPPSDGNVSFQVNKRIIMLPIHLQKDRRA